MDIAKLSHTYSVRRLEHKDARIVLNVYSGNDIFYQFHPLPTLESILEDMDALPPGKEYSDKYFLGFFNGSQLAAVMDLILDYPKQKTGFIGLFIMHTAFQGTGKGTQIVTETLSCLKDLGYEKVQLGIDKGNPQSEAFWTKNGFQKTGRVYSDDTVSDVYMEKML